MSRGLSKIQTTIVGLLHGMERGQVYASCGGGLVTAEILAELVERGLIDFANRKVALFSVRRACDSLVMRGLLEGEYTVGERGEETIVWSAKVTSESTPSKASKPKRGG